ncbi:hypothetical protein U1Q18_032150, partial [Sarracenia purpurea var. burkii]
MTVDSYTMAARIQQLHKENSTSICKEDTNRNYAIHVDAAKAKWRPKFEHQFHVYGRKLMQPKDSNID